MRPPHNEYDWQAVLGPAGIETVGYAFQDELEMWQVLYAQYKTGKIADIVSKYIEGVYRVHPHTVRERIKKSGVKLRGPGGKNRVGSKVTKGRYERILTIPGHENMTSNELSKALDIPKYLFYAILRHYKFDYKRMRGVKEIK